MMVRPIKRLPAALRDQIAAGEVVERPSSVVKELVENALDAGARTIRVEIEGGGLDRIVVTDDGHGMDEPSALLALERHATSKIDSFDDLYRLSSYGFRGEALPSIAAVSKLTLTTKRADALAGAEVYVEGGATPRVREVGAPTGTRVDVASLFFNVPARRKFAKSVATEAAHVGDVCLDLALGRHDIALTLLRDGRLSRQFLRVADRRARALEALGREGLLWVAGGRGHVAVEAMLSAPERARAGATGLHLLVNGRVVRDRALARAVAMAYGSVMEPGRYPVGVVWVDLPLGEVDVNVHPQKAEVRFSRGRELYDDVTRALGASLGEALRGPSAATNPAARRDVSYDVSRATPIPEATRGLSDAMQRGGSAIPGHGVPAADRTSTAPRTRSTHPPTEHISDAATPALDPWGIESDATPTRIVPRRGPTHPPASPLAPTEWVEPAPEAPAPAPSSASESASPDEEAPEGSRVLGTSPAAASSPPPPPLLASSSTSTLDAGPRRETTLTSANALPFAEAARSSTPTRGEIRYSALRFLVQSRATYLLCEGDDGLYVIDQHAAAERVAFARLRAQHEGRSIARQQLLVPEVVEVSAEEAAMVDELHEAFGAFGMDARALGERSVAVVAVPALLSRARPSMLLRDLLDEIAKSGGRRFGEAIDLVLATMACHGSVRAGDVLSPKECEALLRQLDEVDLAGYCPHGRPIVSVLTWAELEKKVGRR